MILAKLDSSWLTILIFVIWAFSALLEFVRRQKKKTERDGTLRNERETRPQDPEQAQRDYQILQDAEREVQNQNYRRLPVGKDLEVSIEDILKSLEPPIESEDEFEELEITPQPLPTPSIAVPRKRIIDMSSPIHSDAITDHKEEEKASLETYFPAGLRSAFVSSEILQAPVSRRIRRRKWI